MSDQFVSEIRMFPFNFAPVGWAFCNGQLLAISQNTALFSLVGTYYGGNGTSNFALPDLQGNAPLHYGAGAGITPRFIGETGGSQTVTLLSTEIPTHTHTIAAQTVGNVKDPNAAIFANPSGRPAPNSFASALGTAQNLNANAVNAAGGNQPHNNMMPYLAVNFCIALQGIFPARN